MALFVVSIYSCPCLVCAMCVHKLSHQGWGHRMKGGCQWGNRPFLFCWIWADVHLTRKIKWGEWKTTNMAFVSTAERVKQENLNLVCIPTSFQVCPAFHSASWHLAAESCGSRGHGGVALGCVPGLLYRWGSQEQERSLFSEDCSLEVWP